MGLDMNVVKIKIRPTMTGNGIHTTYKNDDLADGL